MKTVTRSLPLLLAAATVSLAACADAPATAPLAPPAAPPSLSLTASTLLSQGRVGDTTVTVFVVGTNVAKPASFNIGNSSKIDFPLATGSICDPLLSSYGAGTWDSPCIVATSPVQITAKSWVNAQGKLVTDFQPALRFVPGLKKSVTLYLKDATLAATTNILFCSPSGCVDEAATDPSVTTKLDPNSGFAYRTIKHFSGYMVTVGLVDDQDGSSEGETW
jgi:hypothetical protein